MWNSPREWRPEQPACQHSHHYVGLFEVRRPRGTRHQLRSYASIISEDQSVPFIFISGAEIVVNDT